MSAYLIDETATFTCTPVSRQTKRFISYQEGELLVGWLEEYPDYRTQGETMDELKKNLQELHSELTSGLISCVHKVGELSVA